MIICFPVIKKSDGYFGHKYCKLQTWRFAG